MEQTSKISLKAIDGSDITISYKTTVSEYDTQQMEAVLLPAMTWNPEKKDTDVDYHMLTMLQNERIDKMIAVFVTGWSKPDAFDPDSIKKVLARGEFTKLKQALDKVYDAGNIDSKKKEPTPNSSSEPSNTPTIPSPASSV